MTHGRFQFSAESDIMNGEMGGNEQLAIRSVGFVHCSPLLKILIARASETVLAGEIVA